MCTWLPQLCEPSLIFDVIRFGAAGAAAATLLLLGLALLLRAVPVWLAAAVAALVIAGIMLLDLRGPGVEAAWQAALPFGAAALLMAWSALRWGVSGTARRLTLGRRALLGGGVALLASAVAFSATAPRAWRRLASERLRVLAERARRPGDPWPRGNSAFLIGGFGAPEMDKVYLEAGGSLSPAVGSFGISLWVIPANGGTPRTSDDLPLSATRQDYALSEEGLPGIRVETEHYQALWSLEAQGVVRLRIEAKTATAGESLLLTIRSVGPAGGPVRKLEAAENSLVVNGRWAIALPDDARILRLGNEREADWARPPAAHPVLPAHVESDEGWGYARVALPANGPADILVTDLSRPTRPLLPLPDGRSLVLDGLPEGFATRLRAQVTSLLLGLVGDQTRPGDPVNYPLAWQRDGAYVVVALARSGHAATARGLARQMAEEDFFGGFGAEADAPGLGLWALGEVATAAADRAFDEAAWPHIARKADLIETLLATTEIVRRGYSGPIVPAHTRRRDLDVVAYPVRDGLIDGRMDWSRPIFYVNAVSHLGLIEAARIAGRLGRTTEQARWEAVAERLKAAWRTSFATLGPASGAVRNPRTAIVGLWPSEVADPAPYAAMLEERWKLIRTPQGEFRSRPLWTYFDLAEAHQWLRLGRPERAAQTIDWFDRHQPAPGLHGFWEGESEENSFGRWQHIRGNLEPRWVTPHYWAAAECLLLGLEILAFVERGTTPALVIGAGVEPSWLARPLAVAGIGTAAGPVAWRWDGAGAVSVEAPDEMPIRLGPAFPPGTHVTLRRAGP
jgi:hypothetical protein